MELNIKDNGGRLIGVAKVKTGSGAVMEGGFMPSTHFDAYAALFAAREAAANASSADQAERLQRDIDGHGFIAQGPLPLPGATPVEQLRIAGDRIRFVLQAPASTKAGA
ncbi:hypothetical protein [Achromobacter piechaudii]|uniref:hypothetical protein n=1 Tax=Achromobacter piechaudii TaxID=72556 RepID=UPI003DA97122